MEKENNKLYGELLTEKTVSDCKDGREAEKHFQENKIVFDSLQKLCPYGAIVEVTMRFNKKEVETALLFYDAAYEKIPELSDIKKEKIDIYKSGNMVILGGKDSGSTKVHFLNEKGSMEIHKNLKNKMTFSEYCQMSAEILKDDSCFLGKECIKSFGELKEEKAPLYDKSPIALARDSENSLTVHDTGGKEKHGIGSPEQIEKVPKQAPQKTFQKKSR